MSVVAALFMLVASVIGGMSPDPLHLRDSSSHMGDGLSNPNACGVGDGYACRAISKRLRCTEDMDCWDCTRMGNMLCGPVTTEV